jgi:hypothetical protein
MPVAGYGAAAPMAAFGGASARSMAGDIMVEDTAGDTMKDTAGARLVGLDGAYKTGSASRIAATETVVEAASVGGLFQICASLLLNQRRPDFECIKTDVPYDYGAPSPVLARPR